MLVVITIISILAGLLVVAAGKALRSGREAKIIAEINQLSVSMEDAKSLANAYPPNCGMPEFPMMAAAPPTTVPAPPPIRSARVMRYLRMRFPRFTPTGTRQGYDTLRNLLMLGPNGTANDGDEYNYLLPNGMYQALDIDTLDQAEALVFWLGGPPTPWHPTQNLPFGSTKLFGFHNSATNPFLIDPLGQELSRQAQSFQFEEARLVDQDNDGWLEYVPPGSPVGSPSPPYVYFDFGTYALNEYYIANPTPNQNYCLSYPDALLTPSISPNIWGRAVPYQDRQQSPTVRRWMEPQSFQIISAGLDNQFGPTQTPIAPWREAIVSSAATTSRILESEFDNLVNFHTATLEGLLQ